MRLFHGGKPGLEIGDWVVPSEKHYVDGCPICAELKAGRDSPFDARNLHPSSVFVTSDREYGRFYASKYPGVDLYVVEPEGELVPSPEDHFPTWWCPRARVVSVYQRFVRFTHRQRVTMLHRWRRADRAVAHAHVPLAATTPEGTGS